MPVRKNQRIFESPFDEVYPPVSPEYLAKVQTCLRGQGHEIIEWALADETEGMDNVTAAAYLNEQADALIAKLTPSKQ